MGRGGTKKTQARKGISLLDLPMYRGYTFAWFSEIALKLCTGRDLGELSEQTLNNSIAQILSCVKDEIENLKKRDKDPCKVKIVPLTGNDPKDKMNLCYAYKILAEFSTGVKHGSLVLPSAYSLEFTEYTRAFMGSGKLKREIFKVDEEVLALALIGSYISKSYVAGGEYGYIYIDVVPYKLALDRARKMNSIARRLVNTIQKNNGSINTVLTGVAAVSGLVMGKLIADIVKEGGSIVANYLRIGRTGNKIMVKGFDTVDIVELTKIIVRSGVAGALYAMLRKYPSEDYSALRRFIELTSANLIKFQSLRKPTYIYEILRYTTSDELNKEGAQWYSRKDVGVLGWSDILNRFSRLANLVK